MPNLIKSHLTSANSTVEALNYLEKLRDNATYYCIPSNALTTNEDFALLYDKVFQINEQNSSPIIPTDTPPELIRNQLSELISLIDDIESKGQFREFDEIMLGKVIFHSLSPLCSEESNLEEIMHQAFKRTYMHSKIS